MRGPAVPLPPALDAGAITADGVEIIEGQDAIRHQLELLAHSACDSIRALQPRAEPLEADRPLPRWVPRRVVVEGGAAGEFGSLSVRRSPNPLPCRVVIIDAAIAVTAAPGLPDPDAALLVRQPVLVRVLLRLFEATWATCAPDRPDAPTRNLLELLAAGRTDESIARLLGLSDRQVRRRTAELLRRLGASSRFAAGAEAVRRGWL